jgi:hypothetical protein
MTQPTTYAATHHNAARLAVGTVTLFVMLAAAITLSVATSPDGNTLLPRILGSLGGFVVLFVVLVLASLRHHRWTIEHRALLIEERPLVPLAGRRRSARLGFADIAALSRVQNHSDDVILVQSRAGVGYPMGPGKPPGSLPRSLDTAGLEAFAVRVQAAITAAGHQAPPILDQLGFWNRAPGLLYVGLLLLSLAGGVVVSIFSGADVRIGNAAPAAGFLVLLPLGAGWLLRKAWRRRRAVLGRGTA